MSVRGGGALAKECCDGGMYHDDEQHVRPSKLPNPNEWPMTNNNITRSSDIFFEDTGLPPDEEQMVMVRNPAL